MLGKPPILSLFPNSLNKFNKTSVPMQDPLYLQQGSTNVRSSIYLIRKCHNSIHDYRTIHGALGKTH